MKRQSKFNVGRQKSDRTRDGIVFDSVAEMRYYSDIILPQVQSGKIKKWDRQVKYILQPGFIHLGKKVQPVVYVADFVTESKDGETTVIDVKGCPDSVALLKRKLFWYVYPELEYVWVGYSRLDGGWVTYEKIQEGRKQRKKEKKELKNEKE